MMHRKGDVSDMIVVVFWLFVVGIGILSVMLAMTKLLPVLADSPLGDDNSTLAAINSVTVYTSTGMPSGFLIIFFGLMCGVMVSSFFIRSHPIFIPVYILFCIVSLIAIPAIGNAYGYIKDVPEFNTLIQLNSFTQLMDTILSNLVIVSLSVFILSLIIIFAKPGSGNIGGGGGGGPA